MPAKKRSRGRPGKNKKKRGGGFQLYVFRVLRQVHPKTSISKKAMSVMNSFVNDIFHTVATEAGTLVSDSKHQTLGAREMETAVQLVLPGELANHAWSAAAKAVNEYEKSSCMFVCLYVCVLVFVGFCVCVCVFVCLCMC